MYTCINESLCCIAEILQIKYTSIKKFQKCNSKKALMLLVKSLNESKEDESSQNCVKKKLVVIVYLFKLEIEKPRN